MKGLQILIKRSEEMDNYLDQNQVIELAKAAIFGNREAFGSLYEIYALDMYKYALSMCRNRFDAEDAVQETVISVYKSIKSIRKPEKFKAYLFLSLSNTCKKICKNRAEKEVPMQEVEAENAGTHGTGTEFDLSITLKEALNTLDYDSREILVLSVVAGFTSKEIGKILNILPATVRTKQKRALEKVRKELES